ncbi:MAG TPA: 50S ribosomal protein L31 [Thermomicrobiales bacterium]|nr:50S ribosomal protein L31 [Thermomicrobiales bacterium]
MKAGIHPNYQDATVVCACGNTFQTRSTRSTLRVDLCNVCHPFYTGEQRIVDTAGQVERFMKKVETASTNARPSKRQLRIGQKSARLEDDRRRAEEAARAAAADRAAARKAQRDAETQARAEAAAASGEAEADVAEVEATEAPVEATAEA